ncbi:MAG: T9SS type A sorting domain-containing protein [Bacteroidetes bacterium]|nr:T9SS type A sorting domain-containing protein [Bacteroidota bacterium]
MRHYGYLSGQCTGNGRRHLDRHRRQRAPLQMPTYPTSGVSGLALGANTFRWTLPNGSCADSQDDVVITRSDFTTAAAGPDQDVCATTATLAGNAPATGVGTWTVIGGSGTFANANLPTSGVSGLALGANTFRWTLPNGSCADSQDDVVITRSDFTTAAAGPDQNVCATTATLAGNAPATGVGTWTVIGGSGTFANANLPTSGVSGLALGANTFRWTLPNGSCADSQDDVVITRDQPITTLTASASPNPVCSNSTLSLTASNTGGTNITWSWSGPAGFTAATQNTSRGFLNEATHEGVYTVKAINACHPGPGGLTASTASVNIHHDFGFVSSVTVNPNPVCEGSSITLSATFGNGTPTDATYNWSGPNGFTSTAASPTRSNMQVADAGSYDVTVSNVCHPGGQSNGAIASLQPVINATIAVDECMGTSPTDKYYLLVTGSGGTGTLSYSGTPVISVGNQKVYYEPAGSTVNVTITDQAAPTNCTKTVSVTAPSGHPLDIPLTANVTSSVSVNCYDVDLDRWITFRDNSNNAILSINDNINGGAVNNNLGLVNVTVYKDAVEPTTYTTGPNCQTFTDFKAMKRHFRITTTNPPTVGEPVGLRLYFTQAEANELRTATLGNNGNAPGLPCTQNDDFSDNTGLTDLFVTKYSGTNENGVYTDNLSSGTYRVFGTDFGIPGSPDGPLTKAPNQFSSVFSGGPGYHYVQLQVTEFSEFWLHGSYHGAPLPVEMIYFQAEAVNNSYIQLSWATAIEINNDGFMVERSTDAQTWSNIGWVEGHDNATVQHDYSFNDYNVEANVRYYYRLKQLDNDGQFEYTTIVSEMITAQSTFAVKDFVPNPTMNNTSLLVSSSEAQEIEVKFYDILGQVVSSSKHALHTGGNQLTFSLEHLAAGTYTAVVTSHNEVYSKKLVVTR